MRLNFPNPSRSDDTKGHGVQFWCYDRTFEIRFFVEDAALARSATAGDLDEAALLELFGHNVDRIREVADGVHARRHKASHVHGHTLTGSDF